MEQLLGYGSFRVCAENTVNINSTKIKRKPYAVILSGGKNRNCQ